jgi:hypothetical protein
LILAGSVLAARRVTQHNVVLAEPPSVAVAD